MFNEPAIAHEVIDKLEVAMIDNFPMADCPVIHRFTPGLYIREIFMPAGSLITSKIHNKEHPYVVSDGLVGVWTENEGMVMIEAPFTGITKPGTRRVLYIIESTTWVTFHVTNIMPVDDSEQAIGEAVAKIESEIIDNRENEKLKEYLQSVLKQMKEV